MIDLAPAASRMTDLLAHVDDDQLGDPTPCPDMTVGDLIDHIGSLTVAFTASAKKDSDGSSGPPPRPDASNLGPGWRDRLVHDVDALAAAWRDPAAWEGSTAAGGLEFPAEVAGLVTLDELVVHGWDLAVATDQSYNVTEAELAATTAFVSDFEAPRDGSLFGPVVEVPDGAPAIDRFLGLTGRDPGWTPA